MPRRNIRKSKKTGGKKSGVPMPVVIGMGLLALAAALLLVTRTDLGRQLMTAVPSGSPSPTPSGIVWGCKTPPQNGCKCAYSNPQESAAPIKTAYLPAYFKLCSSKLGGSQLSSDATSVERSICVNDCSTYIDALGYKEESPGRPAGAVSAGMCYKVGGSSPVSCRAGARWGDPEPFTWDQCKVQCRCLYKKGTSTQVLSVPNTPGSLEGSFCSASGHPPASMLEKFVGDCPSSCQDATPVDWQYVKLAEPAYLGTCRQNEQCDPTPYVGFTGMHWSSNNTGGPLYSCWDRDNEADYKRWGEYWFSLGVYNKAGYSISVPYDIKVLIKNASPEAGRHWPALDVAESGKDYIQHTKMVTIPADIKDLTKGLLLTFIDDEIPENDERVIFELEIAEGEKAYLGKGEKWEEGVGGYKVCEIRIDDDDDRPAASGSPAPSSEASN